jgi:hypothetical protein
LRQWLNSSESSINWWQNAPSKDKLSDGNNEYANETGFLSNDNFSDAERNMIYPFSHKIMLSYHDISKSDGGNKLHEFFFDKDEQWKIEGAVTNYDSAYYQMIQEKVFLLSVKELNEWVYKNQDILGEKYYMSKPTKQAVLNSTFKSDKISSNQFLGYWTNTPFAGSSSEMRFVHADGGDLSRGSVNQGNYGIRPALQLDTLKTKFETEGDGSASKPYVVKVD